MDSRDEAKTASRTPGKAKGAGFRLKYIGERLKELGAERERLMEERKALKALRKGKTGMAAESND